MWSRYVRNACARHIIPLRDDTHNDVHAVVQYSRPLTSFVLLRPKFFPSPMALDVKFQTKSPPSPNDKPKDDSYMLSGPSFRSAFIFSINLLILSGFPSASFHLVETSQSAFSWLYTLVCAVVQKFNEMFFIYNCSHF